MKEFGERWNCSDLHWDGTGLRAFVPTHRTEQKERWILPLLNFFLKVKVILKLKPRASWWRSG